ncbi:putative two-component system sensor kinase [Vibrio chagasii]|uniref:sensor histidine kinase n=1 Tax=Vibrio TaxID=662 RepID=UPI000769C8BA|nr:MULTISPECIES: sensor histidine kinase [Vibrio]MDE9381685.1 histidine kinase sensor domain-containing protein [Vibrio alginolyticus]MCG9561199.1 histidine kinase sensor domain-containing protein [Vibrio chagasii]MCG9565651.1 histidine kinase sensor domain-containing protein [Vibrio chagasii]MCG9606082.1 histidine kinase sensor domain-containing protein [Vibrio chagasii]MCG9673828.1 histidine kinase sensor domain-containing protein [Vibrio chagasii]
MSSTLIRCPDFIAKRKDGLTFQLFSYLTVILVSILILQGVAERALMKALLKVPESVKEEMLDLAYQANVLIEEGDMDELADWGNAQRYYLFVIDENNRPITHRHMHPHFEFKLKFLRTLDHQLSDRVSKPIFGLPLDNGSTLVIQLPHQFHPAKSFAPYSYMLKAVIALVVLSLFSIIMAKSLQQPLDRLREASRRLAEGDFTVSVVSELDSTTREFNELAHDFDHMTFEIKSLAEKQRRLIRDVSHELRTPLARQNLALHLLRNKVDDKSAGLLDRMESETEEMNKLVGEILEFSRLETSRYDSKLSLMQLEQYCSMLIAQMQNDLKPNQTLVGDLETPTSMVNIDERLLLRVIGNLVGNAIKYAGEHAHISVTTYEMTIDQRYSVISVEDDGEGIPDNKIAGIFDPFTRIESARDKRSGGYGLGLAIVKEAMVVMNGHVTAENRESGGLRVNLMFPISESAN